MSWLKQLIGFREEDSSATDNFHPGIALRRLMYVAAIGALLIVIYALRYGWRDLGSIVTVMSVGIMAGGAALLAGGLLGFLFGVPHTRDDGTIQRRNDPERDGTRESSTSYRPNTSLEQIADWLTKILVGVGLVQIQVIPGKLVSLAKYVAQGLGSETETLALAILIYFSVCGFVFGFLWARLYLPRWFRDADDIQKLEQKVSQLEKRQAADAKALALTDQVLNRNADDPVSSDDVVANAIKSASKSVRVQIFRQAEKASLNTKADDYETKIEGVISILKGLIESDTKDYYHRNHSELAYALRRKKPEEWDAAEKEITRAIEIRDRLGIKGWKSYHLQRARCRIMQDKEFNRGQPSDAAARKSILDDLLAAYSDTEKWKRWTEPGSGDTARNIRKWCQLNNINEVSFA